MAHADRAWADIVEVSTPEELRAPLPALRRRIQQCGLGPAERPLLWMQWSGASTLRDSSPRSYAELLSAAQAAEREGCGDEALREALAQIDLDTRRTFPDHAAFRDGDAPDDGRLLPCLRSVLAALAHSRPDVGYQQGMNELAGLALLARWQPALGPQPRDPNAAAAAQLWLSVQLQRLRPQAAAI